MPLIALEAFVGLVVLAGCVRELVGLRRDRRRREGEARKAPADGVADRLPPAP